MKLDTLKTQLSDLIKSLKNKVPYAAALFKSSAGTRISVNRVQENVEPEDPSEGLVITVWNGQSFFEYSTNNLDWTHLKTAATDLAQMATQAVDPTLPSTDMDPGEPLEQDFLGPSDDGASLQPLSEKIARARSYLATALAHGPIVANAVSLIGDQTQQDLFVNRNQVLTQTLTRTESMMLVFVTDGKKTCEVFQGLAKHGGIQKTALTSGQIAGLVEDGRRLLGATRLTPGLYDVITDSEWSGIIAHECFGHGMETDLYVRERALSQRYINQPIASPLVNMGDDPSLIEEAGGFFFDDEGQLAEPTRIIENGILKRGLTDLASAHTLHLPRSANGRRESFERKAYARMTNTFFDNGTHTKEEMIASIEKGVYLRHATNGMEDPQAWGIQVEGLWAEEIKNGKLTGRVFSPVIMTGFVPDLLKSISMVGNDRWISGLGMCGKGHKEWVKNTTGGPHLKMRARLA